MKKLKSLSLIIFLIAIISTSAASLFAQEKKSVFIDKFEIHSPDKGDEFLIPGIESILKTKISSVGVLKDKKEADYAIQGSIIIIENSCITTASLKKNDSQILGFSKKGDSKGAVIDHISEFSDKCVTILKSGTKQTAKNEIVPVKENKVITTEPKIKSEILFSSGLLDDEIKSICPIDVDMDGRYEIAVLGISKVSICRIENSELTTISSKDLEKGLDTISIESTKNFKNRPQLIVNSYNKNRNRFSSKSFSFDKKINFVKEDIPANYFYRSFYHQKKGKTIIAKQGSISKDKLFYGPFKKLTISDKYEFTDFDLKIQFDRFPSISPIVIDNRSTPGWMILKNGYLSLFSDKLDEIWRSGDKYGGSMKYIDIPAVSRNDLDERHFISQRLIRIEDKSGKDMMLCVKNNDSGKRLFQRVRFFSEGSIKGLVWNKVGVEETFSSKTFQGWISDFALLDIDGDGNREIILANPQRFGTFSTKAKTRIIITKFKQ